MKRIFFTFFILVFILYSCSFQTQRRNEKSDLNDAESVLNSYWSFKLNNNIDSLSSVFSEAAFKKTPKSKFNSLFKQTFEQYGELQDYKLKDWQTYVVDGTNPAGQYQLLYESYYKSDTINEIFYLERNSKNKIEIISYSLNY